MIKFKSSYDFYLILATAVVLFAICLISIYGMFYFKFAQIHQMAPAIKISYMNRMNTYQRSPDNRNSMKSIKHRF